MTELTFAADELTVHVYCDDVDAVLALDEAQHRGVPLGGPYSALYHKAHTSPGQDHIQAYMKNNKLFALNVSGSAHDRSHGVRIPNRVAKAIRQHFPNVQLPPNNIIECIRLLDDLNWLTEEAQASSFAVEHSFDAAVPQRDCARPVSPPTREFAVPAR